MTLLLSVVAVPLVAVVSTAALPLALRTNEIELLAIPLFVAGPVAVVVGAIRGERTPLLLVLLVSAIAVAWLLAWIVFVGAVAIECSTVGCST